MLQLTVLFAKNFNSENSTPQHLFQCFDSQRVRYYTQQQQLHENIENVIIYNS